MTAAMFAVYVSPDDRKQAAQCHIDDEYDSAQHQRDHELQTEKAFENKGHATELRDQVNDARCSNNKCAPGP